MKRKNEKETTQWSEEGCDPEKITEKVQRTECAHKEYSDTDSDTETSAKGQSTIKWQNEHKTSVEIAVQERALKTQCSSYMIIISYLKNSLKGTALEVRKNQSKVEKKPLEHDRCVKVNEYQNL